MAPSMRSGEHEQSALCLCCVLIAILTWSCRLTRDFAPPTFSLKDVHNAVPKHLLKRSSALSTYYVIRDLVLGVAFFAAATKIEPFVAFLAENTSVAGWKLQSVRAALWLSYWWFQGLVGGGIFCLGASLRCFAVCFAVFRAWLTHGASLTGHDVR